MKQGRERLDWVRLNTITLIADEAGKEKVRKGKVRLNTMTLIAHEAGKEKVSLG